MNMKYAIIVAGGSGTRMKSEIPKQFIDLCGRPVLMHTLETFHAYDSTIRLVLVLPPDHIAVWNELCKKHSFDIRHETVAGGETRFHSVKNGLEAVPEEGFVAVHDGVRPMVSFQTLTNCFNMAALHGNAIPVIPFNETVRQVQDDNSKCIDRTALRLVQTPQIFSVTLLKEAYKQPYSSLFTDDASVAENSGSKIHMVDGNRENIKITEPFDLIIAEAFLNKGNANL